MIKPYETLLDFPAPMGVQSCPGAVALAQRWARALAEVQGIPMNVPMSHYKQCCLVVWNMTFIFPLKIIIPID